MGKPLGKPVGKWINHDKSQEKPWENEGFTPGKGLHDEVERCLPFLWSFLTSKLDWAMAEKLLCNSHNQRVTIINTQS